MTSIQHLMILILLSLSVALTAQNSYERTNHYNLENGLALQGYDPVSYFTKGLAEKGSSKFNASYQDVTYHFVSQANKDLFIQSPAKYEPQYGGWCAFAMGDYAKKVEIDPKTFKLADGKLYLFYNAYLNNTLKSWNKDESNLKSNADKNWVKFIRPK